MTDTRAFSFIPLPGRSGKPRRAGLTMIIDRGMSTAETNFFAQSHPDCVDVAKLGFGTARLENASVLKSRIFLYLMNDIGVMPGGTLLEIACAHGVEDRFLNEAGDLGFTHVEVSSGTYDLDAEKPRLIRMAKDRGFKVFAEAGKKKAEGPPMTPKLWAYTARRDLDEGVDMVVLEGRESGTFGIYLADGTLRRDVIDAVLGAVPLDRVMFEAPQKRQQVHFIQEFGNEVNLGNVAPEDALALETLRLGLRGDTAPLFHPETVSARGG